MGSSESKLATVSTPKPDPQLRIKNQRVAELADPRSPTTGIDRTPIQLAGAVSKTREGEDAGSSVTNDPRSPTHGISRTPLKDSMRVTVSSFARRLGMLFLNESSVDEAAALPHVTFTKHINLPVEELGTTEPLLTPHPSRDSCSRDGTTVADVHTPSQGYGSLVSSPFVVIGEMEVHADLSLEEAEDALVADSSCPLKRELSLSLLTCHDGIHPSQICENEGDGDLVPALGEVAVGEQGHEDHAYALPTVCTELMSPVSPLLVVETVPVVEIAPEVPVVEIAPEVPVVEIAPEVPVVEIAPEVPVEETAPEVSVEETAPVVEIDPELPVVEIDPELPVVEIAPEVTVEETAPVVEIDPELPVEETAPELEIPVMETASEAEVFEEPVELLKPEVTEEPEPIPQRPSTPKTTTLPAATLQPQAQTAPAHTGIRCPTFDTKSPSQVVFKPQWLGVGFGATGTKPRGMQGRGKGVSSPLSSRKSAESENQGLSMKPKHRGKGLASEGRSPLQILRETNSPRENTSQMKLKISTPDRQRLGQLDRRALIQSMNRENQR